MADVTLNITGDIANDAVTNGKLANMAQGTVKGRADGAGTGDPQDLTADQVSTILDAATDPFVRESDLETSIVDAGTADVKIIQASGGGLPIALKGLTAGDGVVPSSVTGNIRLDLDFSAADRFWHGGTGGAPTEAVITAAGRALLDDANATAQRATLGLGSLATVTPTGTPDGTKFLRDDGSWQNVSGGGGGINDGDTLTTGLTFPNEGLHILDTNASHDLILKPNDNLTADRTLRIELNDVDRKLTLSGDADISGTNTGDQDLSSYVQDGDILTSGLTFPNGGLLVKDVGGSNTLNVAVGEDLTADRQLSILVSDGDRTLQVTGNAAIQGTNTGDQTITLTGDVTGSGTGSFAATIANDAVTYAKMQNVSATDRILGRSSAGSGNVEEITCTAAGRAILDDADAKAQRVTLGTTPVAMTPLTGGTQNTTSTSLADVNDSTQSLDASTWYEVEWNFIYQSASTNTGAFFAIAASGAVDYVSGIVFYDCGVGDGDSKVFNDFNQGIAMPSSRTTTNNRGLIRAMIQTSGAVDVYMRFATETGGSAITMTDIKGFKRKL